MSFKPSFPTSTPRIYKYNLGAVTRGILITDIVNYKLLDILDIQEQGDELVLWAVVDILKPSRTHTVHVYSAYTGDPPPNATDWFYVKTIQSRSDGLVYHLYMKHDWE